MRRTAGISVCAAGLLAAGAALAAAAPAGSIYPASGKWTGYDKHGQHKQTFKVAKDGKHVYDFRLKIPYTCANGTPAGYIIVTRPKATKINAYNGYFSIHGDDQHVQGLSDDLNWEFDGFFDDHGKRAKLVKGGIGTDFDTTGGDYCSDRFDKWKGAIN